LKTERGRNLRTDKRDTSGERHVQTQSDALPRALRGWHSLLLRGNTNKDLRRVSR
jgi:hypothetical protein